MLTLKDALEGQRDLASLCIPKSENRFEVYPANDNYGHAYILKKYAGYPLEKSLNFTFPHGIYLRDNAIALSEKEASLPAHFNFPPFTDALWKKQAKNKRITPMAAPIHYALKMFKPEVDFKDRKGTLFVPVHSTAMVDAKFDDNSVIKQLMELPEKYQPITLCVHWADAQKGRHLQYQEAGFDVVCAGHFTDYQFLFRWLHLTSQFSLVASVGIGSSLFYSTLLGVPYLLLKNKVDYVLADGFSPFGSVSKDYTKAGARRVESIYRLFSEVLEQPTQEQIDLVNLFTRGDKVLSPQALNKQFMSV